ncbi:MAG: hypothetical protein U0136_15835 [Bdellovibrionota bacterium]
MSSTLVQASVGVSNQGNNRKVGQATTARPTQRRRADAPMAVGIEECSFGAFGKWCTPDIGLTGPTNYPVLARWIAVHAHRYADESAQWQACCAAFPKGFTTFRGMSLFDASLHLPCGQSVFQYLEEPTQIPDSPPMVVRERLVKAILENRTSRIYCLEPVFDVAPDKDPVLLTVPMLLAQARAEREAVFELAERFGYYYRLSDRVTRVARGVIVRAQNWLERKALEAELARIGTGVRELTSYHYDDEVRRLRNLQERAKAVEMTEVGEEFAAAVLRLRKIDPILTFVRPGETIHRFIGHWYWTLDENRSPVVRCHV